MASGSRGHGCAGTGEHRPTFGAEEGGVAGLVAEGLPIVLGREGGVKVFVVQPP